MTQKAIELKIWEVRENREFLWYFWFNEKWRQLVKVKCLECWAEKVITKYTFTRNVWCRECKQKEISEMLRNISTKHWLAKNKWHRPLYDIYMWIISRCNNPKNHAYGNYWGRGIKCEWNNVEEFVRDMWEWYKKWLSIDRIDVNWNYCKENCRWVDRLTQQNNRRDNIYIEIDWIRYNSIAFAEKYKVSKATASHRICWYLHGRYTIGQITKEWTKFKKNMTVNIDWKEYNSKDIVDMLWCHRCTAVRRIHKYNKWEITKEQVFEKPKERYLRKERR